MHPYSSIGTTIAWKNAFYFIVLYSHGQLYKYTCGNIVNTKKTNGHSSLEKYTSHFIERVVSKRRVGDRKMTATYWPPNSSGYNSISLPFSWAAQPGVWGPSLCWDMVLIPASSLQLIWASCRRGYITIWHPPTFCESYICTQFNPSTVKVIPWSPDIFDRMHLLITQVHFFFWQLGRGQYVTIGQVWLPYDR